MLKLFNLFFATANKKDKGIKKADLKVDEKYGFSFFFKILKTRVGKIATTNLLYLLACFPVIFIIIGYSGIFSDNVYVPQNQMYSVVADEVFEQGSPVADALKSTFGMVTRVSVDNTVTRTLKYGGALLLFLTFGFANVGTTYILRGLVRCQQVFVWSDFISAIKKNRKQGIFLGMLDLLLIFLLGFDIISYSANSTSFLFLVFYYLSIVIALLYFVMRFYMYHILITFDLPIRKILKNSFIFSLIGIKRNICGVLGIVLTAFINYYIIALRITTSIGIVLPFIFTVAFCSFIAAYCAYPNIKRVMIDPYYDSSKDDDSDNEPVFIDRG